MEKKNLLQNIQLFENLNFCVIQDKKNVFLPVLLYFCTSIFYLFRIKQIKITPIVNILIKTRIWITSPFPDIP